MTLHWDLEHWLTEIGVQVVDKKAAHGRAALSEREKLIYEIWLLDTEARNGGSSQYFANWGMQQWEQCSALAMAFRMPSFPLFAKLLSDFLKGDPDPDLA